MGSPEKRRTVRAMLKRWERDEARLEKLFGGPVTTEDLTHSGEMLRNLGSAIAAASGFILASESKPVP